MTIVRRVQAVLATLGYVLSPDRRRALLVRRDARPDDIHYGYYNGLGGNQGLSFLSDAPTQTDLYLLVAVAAIAITIITSVVVRGRTGLGLMAVRDDEDVAERVGVATFKTKLVAFTISATILLAGSLPGTVDRMQLIGVIAVNLGLVFAALVISERLDRLLGVTGRAILTRLLGVILAALAAQFVVDGVRAAMKL